MEKKVSYDSLGWKLLLLGLTKAITAILVSSGLGSGRAGSSRAGFRMGCFSPSLPVSSLPQEQEQVSGTHVSRAIQLLTPPVPLSTDLKIVSHGSMKRLKDRKRLGR